MKMEEDGNELCKDIVDYLRLSGFDVRRILENNSLSAYEKIIYLSGLFIYPEDINRKILNYLGSVDCYRYVINRSMFDSEKYIPSVDNIKRRYRMYTPIDYLLDEFNNIAVVFSKVNLEVINIYGNAFFFLGDINENNGYCLVVDFFISGFPQSVGGEKDRLFPTPDKFMSGVDYKIIELVKNGKRRIITR